MGAASPPRKRRAEAPWLGPRFRWPLDKTNARSYNGVHGIPQHTQPRSPRRITAGKGVHSCFASVRIRFECALYEYQTRPAILGRPKLDRYSLEQFGTFFWGIAAAGHHPPTLRRSGGRRPAPIADTFAQPSYRRRPVSRRVGTLPGCVGPIPSAASYPLPPAAWASARCNIVAGPSDFCRVSVANVWQAC